MRIRGWQIDGFGIHRNFRVDDLSRGLTVFYGANEAGKSTLLAFLRGVLFGYPDGRSSDPKYPPVGGGVPHGGRITLESDEGRCVVERFAGRGGGFALTLEDGRAGSAADLAARLGHADARLFRSIYAFGLSELQELGSLSSTGIQDQLFSAGVTGAGRSARQASRDFAVAARELFAGERSRKSDRVAPLLRAIDGIGAELALRQEAALRHPDVSGFERSLAARLVALEQEAEQRREDEQRALRTIELWQQVYCPLADLREQASKLSPGTQAPLPADAQARLEQALSKIERVQERLESVRAERSALDRQQDELRLDEAARVVAPRVTALHEQRGLYRGQRARLDELRSLRAETRSRVRSLLERLGDGVAESALRALRPTAARRAELREWKRRLDEHRSISAERTATHRLLEEQRERSRADLRDLEQSLAERLRGTHTSVASGAAALGTLRTLALRQLAANARAGGAGAIPFAFAAAVLIAIGGVIAWRVAGTVAGLAAAAAAILAAAAALLARRARRRASHRVVAELAAEAAGPLAALGMQGAELCEATLARAESVVERGREQESAEARLREATADARARLDGLESQLDAARGQERERAEELARLELGFAQFRERAGIPPGFGVEAAVEFFEDALRGQDALEEEDRLAAETRRLEAEVGAWEQGVDALQSDCPPLPEATEAVPPSGDAPRIEALTRLRLRCESDQAARAGRKLLERQVAEVRERFVSCERLQLEARGELAALLDESGAADPEALQRRIAARDAADALTAQIARTEDELARRLDASGAVEAERLRAELSRGCVTEWEERARDARADASRIGAERDEVLRRHQDAARALERLEDSTEVMELELRRSALREELREVLAEWLQLRLSRSLVEKALERFEAKHQPGVFREASRLFAEVTGGRYRRIVQSDDRAGFSVIGADGMQRSPESLSRGTAEQLYLSIRLGLVSDLSRTRVALPVVMDDVLVNFDDARAAAMARVLGAFAADHQLLFFTCSSRTRDLIAGASPAVDVRSLELRTDL